MDAVTVLSKETQAKIIKKIKQLARSAKSTREYRRGLKRLFAEYGIGR